MVLGLRIKGITRAEPVMPMWGYQSNFSGLHSLLSKVLGWCHTTRCFGRFRDALHGPDIRYVGCLLRPAACSAKFRLLLVRILDAHMRCDQQPLQCFYKLRHRRLIFRSKTQKLINFPA